MKMWLSAAAVAVVLGAAPAWAQDSYLTQPSDLFEHPSNSLSTTGGGHSLFGLLGSSNFHISNETSFSVTSGSSGSLSQGLNVTRLSYLSGSPLSLSVGLGNLFMSSGSYLGYSAKPGFFLHDLSARYQLGEHSLISIQYQQAPGTYARPGLYGYGYDSVFPTLR